VSRHALERKWTLFVVTLALSCAPLLAICAVSSAAPPTSTTRLLSGPGKIVPIPASIPHEAGDMVDKRILPDLRWLAQRYPILITDGYSGPLLSGKHAGCNRCHVRGSDHYNGLAVDIVPTAGGTKCDAAWAPITRLALWAEPTSGHPRPPFRWVGYDGDAGHGCGHHLHLSWNHATAAEYQLAEWVEAFPVDFTGSQPVARAKKRPAAKPAAPAGPPGGIAQMSTGGVSPRLAGD
jgi:hypothetical protein